MDKFLKLENEFLKIKIDIQFGGKIVQILDKKNKYGVDGIMIGRASIGNPWIFNEIKHYFETGEHLPPPSISQKVDAARDHLVRSVKWKGEKLGILEMRRHYTNYFKGIPHFKDYRMKLVTSFDYQELLAELDNIEHQFANFATC